ncbi:MAG: hypothetical protein Q8M31_16390 [Beijerinckiaceae bacterium]|nr:hypothetical protein [Beijerinckiaceae bacterium]
MANASKTRIGKGAKGKGAGVGAMTTLPEGVLGDNMTLSNRDKSHHTEERGLDSRALREVQRQDSVHNQRRDPE